ncbi:MAG: phage portal protein [Desulfobacterales bacterium]|nr:phage portal protein [Desulfobacterales bacterium]
MPNWQASASGRALLRPPHPHEVQMTYDEQFLRDLTVAATNQLAAKRLALRDVRLIRANYQGAQINRLTNDWPTSITSPSAVLRSNLRTLRARSRDLAINNDYARAFLWMCAKHIAGPDGIQLQNKARSPAPASSTKPTTTRSKSPGPTGTAPATSTLPAASPAPTPTASSSRPSPVTARSSSASSKTLTTPAGFALQFLEADHLDESLNVSRLPNGNQIRMGVEFNGWMRPVAYHLLVEHPGDYGWTWSPAPTPGSPQSRSCTRSSPSASISPAASPGCTAP